MKICLFTCAITIVQLLAPFTFAADSPQRPNIVFVLTDDQRWDTLSCAGHPFLKTPNIDRLATEGAMFQNAFVTTPLCSPSRASFLTGQYVHKNRVFGNGDSNALSHQLVTWPKLLKDAGYQTAWIGKIHMGSDSSPRPGFDHWISFKGQGVFNDPVLNINGAEQKTPGYITDLLSNYAVDFVRKDHGGKPFVLCLAHKAVHQPFTPADRHKEMYADDPIERRPNVNDTLEGKPLLQRRPAPATQASQPNRPRGRAGGPGQQPLVRNQLRSILSVDDGVGQILKALEETGQLDNTLFIYTSDNGYFWGEHKLGDKRAAYEESIRIPLLMRYPKLIKPGTKPPEIVLNIDIAPTVLQLAGARIPDNIDGKSLVPIFENKLGEWRSSALLEYFMEPRYTTFPDWQSVRTDRWKLIHYPDTPGDDELYDLQTDPYEMKNLITDPASAEQLKLLQADMTRQLDATK